MSIAVPRIPKETVQDHEFCDLAHIFANDTRVLYETILGNQQPYETLRATGVVRRLIMDKHPIAPRIAKQIPMPLHFIKHQRNGTPTSTSFDELPEVYQVTAPKKPKPRPDSTTVTCVYTVDEYRKCSLGVLAGQTATPKQIVKIMADKLGGVHFDRNFIKYEGTKDEDLASVAKTGLSFILLGQSPLELFARNVIFDVFHACSPILRTLVVNGLVEEVINDQKLS